MKIKDTYHKKESNKKQISDEDENDSILKEKKKKKTVAVLSLAGVLMFGFAFALVPLYSLICEITGVNYAFTGKRVAISSEAELKMKLQMDDTRRVNVEFDATINKGTRVKFYPKEWKLNIRPGEYINTAFIVKNLTGDEMETSSVVSFTPWQTAKYVKKVECFCFSKQVLAPNEEAEMGLVFYIDPELPLKYKTVTMSYTIVDVGLRKNKEAKKQAKLN